MSHHLKLPDLSAEDFRRLLQAVSYWVKEENLSSEEKLCRLELLTKFLPLKRVSKIDTAPEEAA